MTHSITQEDIQQLLRSRDVTTRESGVFSPDPREGYKEEKKERQKESSRLTSEDVNGVEVSSETCLLAPRSASDPLAFASSKIPLESETSSPRSQSRERGIVISPRELTTRYSGISVQHVRSVRGVKLTVTLQQPEWQQAGTVQLATAELKRYDRMREVQARASDTAEFHQYLHTVKTQLLESEDRTVCIGRLHHRGRRAAWLQDTLMVAVWQQDQIRQVMLYLEGEEYLIDMSHAMSPNQQKFYQSAGIQGEIHAGKSAPRLADLPLTKFGGY